VVAFLKPGAVRMGPLALTRAMCPPGSLSDRFARDVERAVRWTVRDGHLHLELPEASGILWLKRRTDGPFRSPSSSPCAPGYDCDGTVPQGRVAHRSQPPPATHD
jgi:hypothetical protein